MIANHFKCLYETFLKPLFKNYFSLLSTSPFQGTSSSSFYPIGKDIAMQPFETVYSGSQWLHVHESKKIAQATWPLTFGDASSAR